MTGPPLPLQCVQTLDFALKSAFFGETAPSPRFNCNLRLHFIFCAFCEAFLDIQCIACVGLFSMQFFVFSPEHTNKKECIAQMHDRWKRSGNEKKEINCTSHSNAQWVEIKELELHFTLHNCTATQPPHSHTPTLLRPRAAGRSTPTSYTSGRPMVP